MPTCVSSTRCFDPKEADGGRPSPAADGVAFGSRDRGEASHPIVDENPKSPGRGAELVPAVRRHPLRARAGRSGAATPPGTVECSSDRFAASGLRLTQTARDDGAAERRMGAPCGPILPEQAAFSYNATLIDTWPAGESRLRKPGVAGSTPVDRAESTDRNSIAAAVATRSSRRGVVRVEWAAGTSLEY